MTTDRRPSSEELERWFQTPEIWATLSSEYLRLLLVTKLTHYGATNAAGRVPLLKRLYEHAADRLPVDDRISLLQATTEFVERKQISVNALLPFILADPEHVVVSSAALSFAVMMPLHRGDPLTGPRYLLEHISSAHDNTVEVGVLSALLLLGDRRVVEMLDGSWAQLDYEATVALTHARSGHVFAAVVEFYLSWLESLDDHIDGNEFGAVAAALVRIPASAPQGYVADVRRKFPANADDDRPEIELIGRWTVEEFGRLIEPRLRVIHQREQEPRITTRIFEAWDLPAPASAPSPGSVRGAGAGPRSAGSPGRRPGNGSTQQPADSRYPASAWTGNPQAGSAARSSRSPVHSPTVGVTAAALWHGARAMLPLLGFLLVAFVGWDVYKGIRDGVGDTGWGLYTIRSVARILSMLLGIASILIVPEILLLLHVRSVYDGSRVKWRSLLRVLGTVFLITAAVTVFGRLLHELARSWPDVAVRGGRILRGALTSGILGVVYCAFRANTAGDSIRETAEAE